MKETMFDVLMYLFEHYLYDDQSRPEAGVLRTELTEAGFETPAVDKAFRWLDDLEQVRQQQSTRPGSPRAVRVYCEQECRRIDTQTRGFLLHLEQAGVVDHVSREVIIDRLMALEEDIDPDLVRWVTLMVLGNQPGQEEAFVWMETMLFEPPMHLVH